MRIVLLGLALVALAFVPFRSAAQVPADIVERPTAAISPTRAQASSSPNIVSQCLVPCGADHLDAANHFDCQAAGPDQITDHTVTVVNGSGNVCVRAVVVNDVGVVSEPSPNSKTVLDVPFAPSLTD